MLARIAKNAARNQLIVKHYIENRETYGKTIVFAVDTLHAQTLAAEFKKQLGEIPDTKGVPMGTAVAD